MSPLTISPGFVAFRGHIFVPWMDGRVSLRCSRRPLSLSRAGSEARCPRSCPFMTELHGGAVVPRVRRVTAPSPRLAFSPIIESLQLLRWLSDTPLSSIEFLTLTASPILQLFPMVVYGLIELFEPIKQSLPIMHGPLCSPLRTSVPSPIETCPLSTTPSSTWRWALSSAFRHLGASASPR